MRVRISPLVLDINLIYDMMMFMYEETIIRFVEDNRGCKPHELVEVLSKRSIPIDEVSSQMWDLLDRGKLSLSNDWELNVQKENL